MSAQFEQSPHLAAMSNVRHGFFGRQGGVSVGDFASNNMSVTIGDAPHLAEANRSAAARSLGYARQNLCLLRQVHSAKVQLIDDVPHQDTLVEADAMVTRLPGIALGILTADCTPILLADPVAGVIGAAHAGWRGAVDGIVGNTVASMVGLGARLDRIVASIGPTISGPNYEVGEQFRLDFLQIHPGGTRFFHTPLGGHAHFDLPRFVTEQLGAAGVVQLDHVGLCTYGQPERYFSHRYATHQGTRTGRQISIIGLT